MLLVGWTDDSKAAFDSHIKPYLWKQEKMVPKKEIEELQTTLPSLKNIPYYYIRNKMNADLQKIRRYNDNYYKDKYLL